MKELKDKIINEGKAIGTQIVKVDGFVNHQIDVAFMNKMGETFAARFSKEKIDKILTVEASGIAIACVTAQYFDYPRVVFAKKIKPSTLTEGFYCAEAKSFTKGTVSNIVVSEKFINKGENILIIDDFLAHGEASLALAKIVENAGAKVAGIGIVIEKAFQGGGKKLREAGYKVESLAIIKEIVDGEITFKS